MIRIAQKIAAATALLLSTIGLSAQQRVLAHRAGRADFEENILSSFQASYDAGMRSFETDIRITADGRYVISHDADMSRMYGRPGIIEQTELKTAPAAYPQELLEKYCDEVYAKVMKHKPASSIHILPCLT